MHTTNEPITINEFQKIVNANGKDWPLAKEFIKKGHGQNGKEDGNYSPYTLPDINDMCSKGKKHTDSRKSGTNEKEHILAYLLYNFKSGIYSKYKGSKSVKNIYASGKFGSPVKCKEFYICFAEISGIDKKIIQDGINAAADDKKSKDWHTVFKAIVTPDIIETALQKQKSYYEI